MTSLATLLKTYATNSTFQTPLAFGLGLPTQSSEGKLLDLYFPALYYLEPATQTAAAHTLATFFAYILNHSAGNSSYEINQTLLQRLLNEGQQFLGSEHPTVYQLLQSAKNSKRDLLLVFITEDKPPTTVEEIYLKLSLLSHRGVQPHQLNLTGIFKILPNVAWTSEGAIDPAELPARLLQARLSGQHLEVYSVDKFPKMLNFVLPSEVRIADGARVRLGACLGKGTTVMHEGFVNFNAGTEGPNMVEGRISAGVTVGAGSDLGGGSSTMGTLSGGNEVVISVGKHCLLGANAGTGIPLGDYCTIEAGLYLTAASKVLVLNDSGQVLETVRARDLAFRSHLLFRRNSLSGAIEALPNKKAIALNTDLHSTY